MAADPFTDQGDGVKPYEIPNTAQGEALTDYIRGLQDAAREANRPVIRISVSMVGTETSAEISGPDRWLRRLSQIELGHSVRLASSR